MDITCQRKPHRREAGFTLFWACVCVCVCVCASTSALHSLILTKDPMDKAYRGHSPRVKSMAQKSECASGGTTKINLAQML